MLRVSRRRHLMTKKEAIEKALTYLATIFRNNIFSQGQSHINKYEAKAKTLIESIISPIDYIENSPHSLQKLQKDKLRGFNPNLFDRLAYRPTFTEFKKHLKESWLPFDVFPTPSTSHTTAYKNRQVAYLLYDNIHPDLTPVDPLSIGNKHTLCLRQKTVGIDYKESINEYQTYDEVYCKDCKDIIKIVAVSPSGTYQDILYTDIDHPTGACKCRTISVSLDSDKRLDVRINKPQGGITVHRRYLIDNQDNIPYYFKVKIYDTLNTTFMLPTGTDKQKNVKEYARSYEGLTNHLNLTNCSKDPAVLPLVCLPAIHYSPHMNNRQIKQEMLRYYQNYARWFNIVVLLKYHMILPTGLVVPIFISQITEDAEMRAYNIRWFQPILDFFTTPVNTIKEQIGYDKDIKITGVVLTSTLYRFLRYTTPHDYIDFKNQVMDYISTTLIRKVLQESPIKYPRSTFSQLLTFDKVLEKKLKTPLTKYPTVAITALPLFVQTLFPKAKAYLLSDLKGLIKGKGNPQRYDAEFYHQPETQIHMVAFKLIRAYNYRKSLLSLRETTDAESILIYITNFEPTQSVPQIATKHNLQYIFDAPQIPLHPTIALLNATYWSYLTTPNQAHPLNSLPDYKSV